MVNEFINDIGERVRIERLRLDLSQEQFAELMNKKKMSVFRYEKNERVPDACDLELLSHHGVDVTFICTGKRFVQHEVSNEDFKLCNMIKNVAPEQREVLLTLIQNFVESYPKK
jgi:transcriptional regulator with XRE-family HTH domain